MAYKVGQHVVFLRESGHGIVKAIQDNGKLTIEDENGFDKLYFQSDVAPLHSNDYKISDDEFILKDISQKVVVNHNQKIKSSTSNRSKSEIWEIDLHVEEITDSHAGLSNSEILRKQMSALKIFFEQARAKSIRKLVVIHGVGQGVLKHEVREFFKDMDGVICYDANFGEYGKGATTVEINYFD